MARLIRCTLFISLCYTVNSGSVRADDLHQRLTKLDMQRNGLQTETESLERQCLSLLDEYTSAPDRGRIYAQIALIYAQAGHKAPEKTAEYCKKALEYPLDAATAVQMYVFRADALQVKFRGAREDDFVVARDEIVTQCLRGLKLILQENPPKEIQSVPPVDRFDCGGGDDDPVCRELARKNKEQIAARESVISLNTLVHHRTTLMEKIAELYSLDPADIGVLRTMGRTVLEDEEAVEELVQSVLRRIEATVSPSGKTGTTEPPHPD